MPLQRFDTLCLWTMGSMCIIIVDYFFAFFPFHGFVSLDAVVICDIQCDMNFVHR